MNTDYPLWMEIHSQHLHENYTRLRHSLAHSGHTQIIGVVKAEAYGHGLECVRLLQGWGLDRFGVASVQEGEALRQFGITGKIYLLGGFIDEEVQGIFRNNLIPALSSQYEWEQLESAAGQLKQSIDFHLKIDTGMGRMGFLPAELDSFFLNQITHHPYLNLKGIMTHFASSENDPVYTQMQFELFQKTLNRFTEITGTSINSLEKHCCNSAGFLFFPTYHEDLVRLGIAMFGVSPTHDPKVVYQQGLQPVMQIKSRVKHLKDLPSGYCIGYGGTYITQRSTRVAIIPIGYAQGLLRCLSNRMEVLIRGRRAKSLGIISMDQMMVDVTDIPGVIRGDVATILGPDGSDEIRAEQIATWAGTIPHEILCSFVRIKNRIIV